MLSPQYLCLLFVLCSGSAANEHGQNDSVIATYGTDRDTFRMRGPKLQGLINVETMEIVVGTEGGTMSLLNITISFCGEDRTVDDFTMDIKTPSNVEPKNHDVSRQISNQYESWARSTYEQLSPKCANRSNMPSVEDYLNGLEKAFFDHPQIGR